VNVVGKLWNWIRWPFAIGVIALLFWWNRDHLTKFSFRTLNYQELAFAVVLLTASTLCTFYRWYLLVAAQGFAFRFVDAVRLGFLGLLFNYVGPGAVGGDLFKGVALAREQHQRRSVAFATVLLDRVLGLLGLFVLGAITTLFTNELNGDRARELFRLGLQFGSIAGIAAFGVLLWPAFTRLRLILWTTTWPYVGRLLGELIHGVEMYQKRPLVIAAALGLSVLSHGGLIVGFYFGGRSITPDVPTLIQHFVFMPVAETFSAFIPAPGGVGPLEAAVHESYKLFANGRDPARMGAAGLLAATMYRVISIGIAAVGLVYYMLSRREVTAALESAEHEAEREMDGSDEQKQDAAIESASATASPPGR
jgi:uncharacterized membrane protein YbhN (UPF0104 family)